jgi:anti-anti-sigma regulatory factor
MLQAGGVSTTEVVAQGQLLVIPAEDGHLDEQPFDPDERIAGLRAAIDAALADGYSGFRATGEQWTAPEPPPEELLVEYETRVSELCATRSMVGLCQYHGNRCDRRLLDTVCELHGHVVRNALVSGDELLRIVPLSQDEQGNSWLRIVGEADLSNSALLLAALEEEGHGNVHLDLGRLRFVDLKGVEALLELTDALRPSERRLIVHNAPPTLRRIVEIVGDSLPSMEISAP